MSSGATCANEGRAARAQKTASSEVRTRPLAAHVAMERRRAPLYPASAPTGGLVHPAAAGMRPSQVPVPSIPVPAASPLIQRTQVISSPGGPDEREADDLADAVLAMPDHTTMASARPTLHTASAPTGGLVHPAAAGMRPSQVPVRTIPVPAASPLIQRTQVISSPGGPDEREADDLADAVLAMPDHTTMGSAQPSLQRKCTGCEDEEKESIKTKHTPSARSSTALDPGPAVSAARHGGSPLPAELRSYFEPRFGQDFNEVRVHVGPDPAAGARAVQARAYTIGNEIVFGAGEFAPATSEGKRLLAHELAHTMQQAGTVERWKIQRRQVCDEAGVCHEEPDVMPDSGMPPPGAAQAPPTDAQTETAPSDKEERSGGAPPQTQRQQELGEIELAVEAAQWDHTIDLLRKLTDPSEVNDSLGHRTFDQLARLREAADRNGAADLAAVIEPLRVAALNTEYSAAVTHANWVRAALLANAYNDTDLPGKLPTGVDSLSAMKVEADRQGLGRLAAVIEPRRVAALNTEYDAAVAAGNWPRVAGLINAYNDPDLNARLSALDAVGHTTDLDTAAIALQGAAGRIHRTISFRAHDPGAFLPHPAEYTVTNPGAVTTAAVAPVAGGTVTVTTGINATKTSGATMTGGDQMAYSGTDSARTHWLQFIWREVLSQTGSAAPVPVSGTMSTTGTTGGAGYQLTTDPTQPLYNTDQPSRSATPFYESAGLDLRDPSSETMLDAPSPATDKVAAAFAAGADKVTSRAHFSTYLIRDMAVLFRVDLTDEWVFSRSSDYNPVTGTVTPHSPSQHVDGTHAVTSLEPRMRQRLVAQWPAFDYLP
jgi:hypothetical protein